MEGRGLSLIVLEGDAGWFLLDQHLSVRALNRDVKLKL